jgi:hypothetical protein
MRRNSARQAERPHGKDIRNGDENRGTGEREQGRGRGKREEGRGQQGERATRGEGDRLPAQFNSVAKIQSNTERVKRCGAADRTMLLGGRVNDVAVVPTRAFPNDPPEGSLTHATAHKQKLQ